MRRPDSHRIDTVAAISVLAGLARTALAWQAWRRVLDDPGPGSPNNGPRLRSVTAADGDDAAERPNFIGLVAVLVGGLSLLVCIALWQPIWMLSPRY